MIAAGDSRQVRVTSVVLEFEAEIRGSFLWLEPHPNDKPTPVVVAVAQADKTAFPRERAGEIAERVPVCAINCFPNVRGTSETTANNGLDRTGAATMYSSSGQMLGRTLVGA